MKKIAVFGLGYVGLTTAACLAESGHRVVGYDLQQAKVDLLRSGQMPFVEPELGPIVSRHIATEQLTFSTSIKETLDSAEIAFVCVGTPMGPTGAADLSQVEEAIRQIGRCATGTISVVLKSTIPPGGTAARFAQILSDHIKPPAAAHLVVNPEFLREGSAVYDFFHPDRVVVGAWNRNAAEQIAGLYAPLGCPVVLTDPTSAQLIKYAANAFLATKISFINDIARIAESVGANIQSVAQGIGLDARIGGDFLEPGLGYGGSCFPKDVRALAAVASHHGYDSPLLTAVMDINSSQRRLAVEKLGSILDGLHSKKVCVLGLAFKPDTDDVREAPALDIIPRLCEQGATVHAYDPAARTTAERVLPAHERLRYCADAYEAAQQSHAILIATNWPEFRDLDWQRIASTMAGKTIVDGRGLLSAGQMHELGFQYIGFAS
jgi:UDPglucose 6-dehydrogenase